MLNSVLPRVRPKPWASRCRRRPARWPPSRPPGRSAWRSVHQCEQHRDDRHGEEGPGDAEERGAQQDRAEGDGGVDVDGSRADARLDRDVLDLLVEQAPCQRDDAQPRVRTEQPDQHRQRDGDAGADGRDELGDDARPHGQGQPVGHPHDGEDDASAHAAQQGEDHAGPDVVAGLLGGEVPHVAHDALRAARETGW